jgi:hypothetical protein
LQHGSNLQGRNMSLKITISILDPQKSGVTSVKSPGTELRPAKGAAK